MKWDVKHDRAKKVIDRFLDNAGYWQESEDLVTGLTDEEKELVNAEVELMIASIRKRYKLQERLPEQVAEAEKPAEKAVEEPIEEPVKKAKSKKAEDRECDRREAGSKENKNQESGKGES